MPAKKVAAKEEAGDRSPGSPKPSTCSDKLRGRAGTQKAAQVKQPSQPNPGDRRFLGDPNFY